MRKWSWLVGAVVVILFGVLIWVFYQNGYLITSKSDIAIDQSRTFIRACEVCRQHPKGDGKYPATLTELVDPDPQTGRKPLIDGGKMAITDPWQKPYRYAVVQTESGPVTYVWSEEERGGKLRVFGARLGADGRAQLFGLAD